MKIRLIDETGELIAETEIETRTMAIVFSNRVFISSFTAGTFEYFREITAQRVHEIATLRAEISTNTNGD